MPAIITRSAKGTALTHAEMDQNLTNLNDAMESVMSGLGPNTNLIGVMGTAGAGVGIAPKSALPVGMAPLYGYTAPTHNNYGNYQFSEGSIECWIPKCWIRIGHVDNPTYALFGVNSYDIKGIDTFATTADANAAGYALDRAFIDGGAEKDGFFFDKYKASKNPLGTGFVASSIAGGLPISTDATHNPIADLTACSANAYYEAINAAHARDGVDGAVNPDSQFFSSSRQMVAALAKISVAHAQVVVNNTNCAWFDPVYNFPKGCNNNALGDANDGTVSYTPDGYQNCGKTGSGTPFAKTTHNGQACGVADINGLMYEVNIGLTCIAADHAITAITNANPCKVTVASHGLTTGDYTQLTGIVGMTELNDKIYTTTVIDADNITLDGVDSTGFAAYTSGGTATVGTFYRAADTTEMRKFTAGNSSATDHWGAAGVAAMMVPIKPAFRTDYPNNGFAQRFGNGAEQVLAADLTGDSWELAGLGMPAIDTGLSAVGTNLFGTDYHYQKIVNELCPLSYANWSNGLSTGVWALNLDAYWMLSSIFVGFRCACYPK